MVSFYVNATPRLQLECGLGAVVIGSPSATMPVVGGRARVQVQFHINDNYGVLYSNDFDFFTNPLMAQKNTALVAGASKVVLYYISKF